ncbi:hypothetical protein [Vibrio breoganii]|nr:hypothetical protein [Vibrio breoganii]
MSYVSGATYVTATITELIYCLIGLGYGWMTVALRTRYEQYVEDHAHEGEHLPH